MLNCHVEHFRECGKIGKTARLDVQVQLSMPGAHQEAQQTFKVYCQVVRGVRGGAGLTIHSGIRLHNSCGMLLSIGMQQKWSDSSDEDLPSTTQLVAAGASIWLPALCCNATYLTLQPAGESPAEQVKRHPSRSLLACTHQHLSQVPYLGTHLPCLIQRVCHSEIWWFAIRFSTRSAQA